MVSRAEKRLKFIDALVASGKTEVTIEDIRNISDELDIPVPQWFTKEEDNKIRRGVYRVPGTPVVGDDVETINMVAQVIPMAKPDAGHRISNVTTDLEVDNLVPAEYKNYVPFGNFADIVSIVESNSFFPVFVTGHSGNGKTMSIEQACAKAKRKFVCVSMTPDTDEGDLLGNYVLINGQMEWRDLS